MSGMFLNFSACAPFPVEGIQNDPDEKRQLWLCLPGCRPGQQLCSGHHNEPNLQEEKLCNLVFRLLVNSSFGTDEVLHLYAFPIITCLQDWKCS